jgi:histidine triad (HIT) family protein
MKGCIFCRIVNRELPAEILYEDDEIAALRDVNPQAPVHVLVIPKKHLATVEDADPQIAGKLIARAAELAKSLGVSEKGYRLVINCREHAGQSVNHLHVHIMGGRWFSWPPG